MINCENITPRRRTSAKLSYSQVCLHYSKENVLLGKILCIYFGTWSGKFLIFPKKNKEGFFKKFNYGY